MKTSLFICLLLIGTFQNSSPPLKIINALNKKFPSAKSIHWSKDVYSREWQASFLLGGENATIRYTFEAKWLETTLEIQENELSELIKTAVLIDYPKCKILSAIITERYQFT